MTWHQCLAVLPNHAFHAHILWATCAGHIILHQSGANDTCMYLIQASMPFQVCSCSTNERVPTILVSPKPWRTINTSWSHADYKHTMARRSFKVGLTERANSVLERFGGRGKWRSDGGATRDTNQIRSGSKEGVKQEWDVGRQGTESWCARNWMNWEGKIWIYHGHGRGVFRKPQNRVDFCYLVDRRVRAPQRVMSRRFGFLLLSPTAGSSLMGTGEQTSINVFSELIVRSRSESPQRPKHRHGWSSMSLPSLNRRPAWRFFKNIDLLYYSMYLKMFLYTTCDLGTVLKNLLMNKNTNWSI